MDIKNFFKQVNLKHGVGCEVSEFCSLENVTLGNNVRIGEWAQLKNVVIDDNTKIGVNVRLYSPDPIHPIVIGKECWLSYGVFGEATGGEITLEDYAVIAHRSILLTSSGPGEKNVVLKYLYSEQQGPISIGKYAWIGTQCTLLPNSLFNEGAVLGAHALAVGGEYDAWTVYGGVPAKVLKKIDSDKVSQAKDQKI